MITEIMESAYCCSQVMRLAALLLDSPFMKGELGAILPPGNVSLRDYVNDVIDWECQSRRLDNLKSIYLDGAKP